jgi:hypothetical protein
VHARTRQFLHQSAILNGGLKIKQHLLYDQRDLPQDFRDKHAEVLAYSQWAGLGIWKPKIVQNALRVSEEGDVVLYLDAGLAVTHSLIPWIKRLLDEKGDLMVFEWGDRLLGIYCKSDLPDRLGFPEDFLAENHLTSFAILLRNTPKARDFVDEWLALSEQEGALTPGPSQFPNYDRHLPEEATLNVAVRRNQRSKKLDKPKVLIERNLQQFAGQGNGYTWGPIGTDCCKKPPLSWHHDRQCRESLYMLVDGPNAFLPPPRVWWDNTLQPAPLYPRPLGDTVRAWLCSYACDINPEPVNQANQNFLDWMAVRQNFQGILSYGPQDLDVDFVKKNAHILSEPVGGGYWLWKPYVIQKALRLIPEGDILFYCDTSKVPLEDLTDCFKELASFDLIVLEDTRSLLSQSKRDLLEVFEKTNDDWREKPGLYAGYLMMRNTSKICRFINRWLDLCQMSTLIADAPSELPEYPEARLWGTGRHDQAILSCVFTENQELDENDPRRLRTWMSMGSTRMFEHRRRSLKEGSLYPRVGALL